MSRSAKASALIFMIAAAVRLPLIFVFHHYEIGRPEPIRIAISLARSGAFADPYALPKRWVQFFIRLRVGHVNYVIADVHAAWATELFPFRQEFSILIENLDAVVRPVCNEQAARRVHGESMGYIEFALSRTMVAPGFDEFSVLRIFDDTIVGFRYRKIAVAVSHKDVAVRGNENVGRAVKLIRSVAGYVRLPERP